MSHNVVGSNCFQAQELDHNYVLKISGKNSGTGAVGKDGRLVEPLFSCQILDIIL